MKIGLIVSVTHFKSSIKYIISVLNDSLVLEIVIATDILCLILSQFLCQIKVFDSVSVIAELLCQILKFCV